MTGGTGATLWLTGLPSAGKTTIAAAVAAHLRGEGDDVELLDGDEMRRVLSPDLGFSREDRDQHVSRVAWVAWTLARHGVTPVCAVISPFEAARAAARRLHEGRFFEVFVDAPIDVCRARDVKGLYRRHAAGALRGLTGVDDAYERPERPDLVVPTAELSVSESVALVVNAFCRFRQSLDAGAGAAPPHSSGPRMRAPAEAVLVGRT